MLLSLAVGSRAIAPSVVLDAVFAPVAGDTDHVVVRDLRVPRTVVGLLAGLALGLAGSIMQGVTRNPLADPGLLGVNAGASLFVVVGITFFGATQPEAFVWFAFAGAAAATAAVYAIGASGRGGATPVKLALSGAALTAAITSLITLLLVTNLDTLQIYRFWAVGSLVGRDLGTAGVVLPFLLVGAVLAFVTSRSLNVLSLGDDVARGLGQSLVRARVTSALAIVLLCGSATALAGPLVFVGLVVPHIARRLVGSDYRWILAYSLLLGPMLLVCADIVGRLVAPPGELEAGLVVAFLGAPVLIAFARSSTVKSL
ncbi:iron complex transport system permease protein [Conyzicola nivalis]|uniref:Iron complex transport system permease protein n=1 Tax=Conyzicola nivalis TaxID=1477021 RepID=A0ABV2QJ61_9MICO